MNLLTKLKLKKKQVQFVEPEITNKEIQPINELEQPFFDVNISEEDIKHGDRESTTSCPIALHLNNYTGLKWYVYEDFAIVTKTKTVECNYPGCKKSHMDEIESLHEYALPYKARRFIKKFDTRISSVPLKEYNIEPISFKMKKIK